MDEPAALRLIAARLDAAGDDAAVVDDLVITTDMLHEQTDFPDGVTRYTAGWRAVGASLSDVAAMGASAVGAVAVYAAPAFVEDEISSFLDGATAVCERADTAYVGGDLDTHEEFTVVSTAVGRTADPVYRSGATVGDRVYVTGTLGRTAAGLSQFDAENVDRGNELFRFIPRVRAGEAIGRVATAMIDSSDGLARSLHQLASASEVGMAVRWEAIPVDRSVTRATDDLPTRREWALHVGEDFELVFTAPADRIASVRNAVDVPITEIGTVTASGVVLDGDPLADAGYSHG